MSLSLDVVGPAAAGVVVLVLGSAGIYYYYCYNKDHDGPQQRRQHQQHTQHHPYPEYPQERYPQDPYSQQQQHHHQQQQQRESIPDYRESLDMYSQHHQNPMYPHGELRYSQAQNHYYDPRNDAACWTRHVESDTGEPYWHNDKADEYAYDEPECLKAQATVTADQLQEEQRLYNNPSNWRECVDENSGGPFWFNDKLDLAKWEIPECLRKKAAAEEERKRKLVITSPSTLQQQQKPAGSRESSSAARPPSSTFLLRQGKPRETGQVLRAPPKKPVFARGTNLA